MLRAIRDQMRAAFPGMQVEVIDQQWGRRDKDRQTVKAPSVLLACMRVTPDEETFTGDFDDARIAAVCIAQRADNQRDAERSKGGTAMDLASQVAVYIRDRLWGAGFVKRPTRISYEPVGVDLDDKGYAAWAVYWSQIFDPHAPFDAAEYGPLKAINNTILMGDENTPDKHVTYTATGAP